MKYHHVTGHWRLNMAATGKGPKERPLIERFETAVTVIRSLPKDGPFQPSDMVKLKFYGLYKVVKEGPNNTSKPGIWDPTGRAKWEAWKMCSSLDKEKAMTMYIQELQQIIETMPQTKQVEEFMKSIGPFYEFADDEGEMKEEESGGDEGETVPSSAKKVTFNEQPSSNEDSDGDLEFEDSYDKLPSNTTPPKSSQLLSERRPTPYVHSQATILTDQKPDALSTNLFQSPNTSGLLNAQPTSSSTDSQTLHSLLSQLIHNTQVLTQQFRCLLDQNITRSSSQNKNKRIISSVIGSFVINIIFKYWGARFTTDSSLYWLTMTACHIIFNLLTQCVC